MATEPKYISRKQAAGFFRDMGIPISASTLANYAAKGRKRPGPSFHKLDDGQVLYTKEDLLNWLKTRMRRLAT